MSVYQPSGICQFTGLPNHYATKNRLDSQPSGGALLFLDVDAFGLTNHVFGHERADDMLVALAQALKDALPHGAFLGRIGGDEFLVWVPDAPRGPAAAEQLRLAVAAIWSQERQQIREQAGDHLRPLPEGLLTASIGVALWDGSYDASKAAAAHMCTLAKRGGRNRVQTTEEHSAWTAGGGAPPHGDS